MGKHALLSASSSHRWLQCPPSARLCENYEDKGSDFAAEGTDAHALCEYKLKTALGIPANDPSADLAHYSAEMEDCANSYASYVLEQVEEARKNCPDPQVLIEQRLDYSRFVEGGFGIGDCLIIADGLLHVIDFKYGQGLLVDAKDNPQMMLYALGALEVFDGIYDISTVAMTIFQPRRENVSTHTVFKESLYQWANEVLVPTAKLAFAGAGAFHCGEWCRFCRAKAECRERAQANLALAAYEFQKPALLSSDEIAEILGKVDELVNWASDIKDFALQQALAGVAFSGYKIVEGRSNRKYTSETAVAEAVLAAGYDPYEKALLSVTALEKRLGKKTFADLVGALIEKPPGKPTLVQDSDKRPAISVSSAADDFKATDG
jgi:hypothetical protein